MKKRLLIGLMVISSLLLTACDNYPYKTDIQEIYDWNNQTGEKAICMMVGRVTESMYPYTIYYMEGENLPFSPKTQKANFNRLKNETLHFFSGLGFFTEELVGETEGKPLYRYQLTDLGRKYVDWTFGETNFCFGRIVVDSINRTKETINGVGGGTIRSVYMTYHVENIPDWVKNPAVYERFRYPKEVTTGEPLEGEHLYDVLRDGKIRSRGSQAVNRRFQWATSSAK
ncbi:hypothetical protein RHO13_09910 [Orbus wheelerorum]|uniref:hypothetical protein n=1 Tax=Orbus wheelerorum TaxID=3074111 RepID=UPI00370D946C